MRSRSATQRRDGSGKLRRTARAIKNTVKRWAAVPVLAAGLMLYSTNAKCEEKPAKAPAEKTTSLSASFTAGAYDKADNFILGAELAASHKLFNLITLDAKASMLSRVADSNALELDEIELDLTTPIAGPVSATAFGCRSQYYAVLYGGGVAFHLGLPEGFGLHLAPQLLDGPTVAIPLSATFDSKYVSAMLGAVPIANHATMDKPAPLIGGDAALTVHINSLDIFVRAFEMTFMDGSKASLGILNLQGGVRYTF